MPKTKRKEKISASVATARRELSFEEKKLLAARVIIEEKLSKRKGNLVVHTVHMNLTADEVIDILCSPPFDSCSLEQRTAMLDGKQFTIRVGDILHTLSMNFN